MSRHKKTSLINKIKLFFYKKKYGKRKKLIKRFFIIALWFFMIGGIGILCIFAYYSKDLPDPDKIAQRQIVQSTKIYDRTGEVLLYDIHGEEKRTVIKFDQIPQYMKNATIAAEDDNFYHHFGLDFKAIIRAFFANIRQGGISQGGSTITQQFIKNAVLSPEKTLNRKIKELILSIGLELKYSKDKILEFYLNQIPYGSNAYGIEAAANTFFGKHAKELSLAESAILSCLPQAPTYYSPYGSHPEELKICQERILNKMSELGYIGYEQANQAKEINIDFIPRSKGIKAPHFVMYIKEKLEKKYGKEFLEKGGLEVYTTLDWDLQKSGQTIVSNIAENNKTSHNAHNLALVAIDPKTGQILSMIGSKDYFGEPEPNNCISGKNCLFDPSVNVTTRLRQPGSSFKPIAYATAFKKGYTPQTMIFDLETNFGTEGGKNYIPQNYDHKFRGPVNFRQGLAQSLNVPSVKVLYLAGINKTINTAEDLGITSLKDRSRYGLSLVLGGGEVTLLEQTAAFSVFANNGIKNKTTSILKVKNRKGEVLEEYKDNSVQVLKEQIAYLISDILSDENARAPMFGTYSNLYIEDIPAAAKTGTTENYKDGWTIGYTPNLAVGVWAGNNKPTPMPQGSGLNIAAPTWNNFIKTAYKIKNESKNEKDLDNYFDLPKNPKEFIKPDPIETDKPMLNGEFANEVTIKIDKISEKLATKYTPPDLIEEKIYREVHCILYYLNKDNPQGSENGRDDPQFENWEPPVIKWALSDQREINYNTSPPQEYDDIHTKETQPKIKITSPSKEEVKEKELIEIKASATAKLEIKQLDFFFNNILIGTDTTKPYKISFKIPKNLEEEKYKITVKAYDQYGSIASDSINVFIIQD